MHRSPALGRSRVAYALLIAVRSLLKRLELGVDVGDDGHEQETDSLRGGRCIGATDVRPSSVRLTATRDHDPVMWIGGAISSSSGWGEVRALRAALVIGIHEVPRNGRAGALADWIAKGVPSSNRPTSIAPARSWSSSDRSSRCATPALVRVERLNVLCELSVDQIAPERARRIRHSGIAYEHAVERNEWIPDAGPVG